MGDKIHIRDRNNPENRNRLMEERGWTGGKVFKAILATIFGGIVGGIVYIVMTNNLLKQKNRLVNDHNNKIPKEVFYNKKVNINHLMKDLKKMK